MCGVGRLLARPRIGAQFTPGGDFFYADQPITTKGTCTFVVVGNLAGEPIPTFVSICNS